MTLAFLQSWTLQTLRRAGWAPLLVFGLHVVVSRGLDAYRLFPPLDIPMHFFGGVAIAYFFRHAALQAPRHGLTQATDQLTHWVLVLALTCSATVIWEFAEFVSDHLFGTHAQLGLADTMKDVLMGSLGGLTLAAVTLLRTAAQPASVSPDTPV